jgi:nucleotide-binding universal stress UspA family protein
VLKSEDGPMSGWKSLVVGLDFTPCPAAALRQAISIAERTQAALQVVHVIETLVVMDLEAALRPFQADVRAGPVRDARDAWPEFTAGIPGASALELEVEIDNPVAASLPRVRERSADLLVLGTHGTPPPDRGAGTLATARVRKARAPVLLVRDLHSGPFTSVVACIDFSATSRAALEEAMRVATQYSAALHVPRVFHAPWHRLHQRPAESVLEALKTSGEGLGGLATSGAIGLFVSLVTIALLLVLWHGWTEPVPREVDAP